MTVSIAAITALSETGTYELHPLGTAKAMSVVGGKVAKFVPNANFSFDCGTGAERYWFNVNRKDRVVGAEKERLVDGSLTLTIGDQDDVLRDSPTGIEWDIVLRKKPASNVFEWDLQCSPGVSFHYQPDFTDSLDPLERALAEGRPEHVRGSYAVYCDRRNEYRDAAGNVIADYKTGKLSHIYRPLCHDANGAEVWAELFIDAAANLLRVTVPQAFLDAATYPVTVDPNFGIETEGASNFSNTGYSIASFDTTLSSESGTITELRAFTVTGATSDYDVKVCVFTDNNGPAAKVGTQQIITIPANASTPAWRGVAYSGSLAASTKYWFASNTSNSLARVRYDSITNAGCYMSQTYAAAFSDPWGGDTTLRSYRMSMYVVYTASGGTSVTVTHDLKTTIITSLAVNHDLRATIAASLVTVADLLATISTAVANNHDSKATVLTSLTTAHDLRTAISSPWSVTHDTRAIVARSITQLHDTLADIATLTGYVVNHDTRVTIATALTQLHDVSAAVSSGYAVNQDVRAIVSIAVSSLFDILTSIYTAAPGTGGLTTAEHNELMGLADKIKRYIIIFGR